MAKASVWAIIPNLLRSLFRSDVPIRSKILLVMGIVYLVSPIDLLPDVIAGIGWIDDLVIVPLLGWLSYRSSKAALNQVVRTASIEIARTRPQAVCLALHPGTVETKLSADFTAGRQTFTPAESANRLLRAMDQATPAESGSFLAYDGSKIVW